MVGHAIYPGWDEEMRPASLSPAIATTLLRRRSGFRGALLTDDLEMGALAGSARCPSSAALALAAGCDGLLFCRRLEEAPEIAAAVGRKSLRPRLEQAERRLARLRSRLAAWKRNAPPAPGLARFAAGSRLWLPT